MRENLPDSTPLWQATPRTSIWHGSDHLRLIATAFFELGRIFLKLPKITSDRKSIAWPLTYRASDKTLETAEVDAAHTANLTALGKPLPAKVPGVRPH